MALFKPFSGTAEELNQVLQKTEGYVYLTTDDQKLHADVETESGIERLTLNAQNADFADAATVLAKVDAEGQITETFGPDDFIRKQSSEEGDVIPVAQGGTGATTTEEARTNLDVYSKTEVNENFTAQAFSATLEIGGWNNLTYNLSIPTLKCTVPPIVHHVGTKNDTFNLSAVATPNVGITFTVDELPAGDIDVTIVDIK